MNKLNLQDAIKQIIEENKDKPTNNIKALKNIVQPIFVDLTGFDVCLENIDQFNDNIDQIVLGIKESQLDQAEKDAIEKAKLIAMKKDELAKIGLQHQNKETDNSSVLLSLEITMKSIYNDIEIDDLTSLFNVDPNKNLPKIGHSTETKKGNKKGELRYNKLAEYTGNVLNNDLQDYIIDFATNDYIARNYKVDGKIVDTLHDKKNALYYMDIVNNHKILNDIVINPLKELVLELANDLNESMNDEKTALWMLEEAEKHQQKLNNEIASLKEKLASQPAKKPARKQASQPARKQA